MKYIDANSLRKEIEKNKNMIDVLFTEGDDSVYDGENDAYNRVLRIIDFLQQEQPEVDLEKAAEKHAKTKFYTRADDFIAGAEWQKEKDLALTWEDMEEVHDICKLLVAEHFQWYSDQEFYEEVLRRINKSKEDSK